MFVLYNNALEALGALRGKARKAQQRKVDELCDKLGLLSERDLAAAGLA